MKISRFSSGAAILATLLLGITPFVPAVFAQAAAPVKTAEAPRVKTQRVSRIDALGLKRLTKPNGRPLLINFWATWCDPCRDEFPELVKIDEEFRGKIDFLTVTLDYPEEINRDVPRFLSEMKAEMPTYLLVTPDEDAAIAAITVDWRGGLPFTILYGEKGEVSYFRQGKVITSVLRTELQKILEPVKPAQKTF